MPVRKRKQTTSISSDKELSTATNKKQSQKTSAVSVYCLIVTAVVCFTQAMVLLLLMLHSPIQPASFKILPPPDVSVSFPVTSSNAQRLLEDEIVGPESMVAAGDYLYTGTYNRGVLRINRYTLEVYQLPPLGTPPCGTMELEPTCGRPLGVRIYQDFLYVLDSYLGMFKYDMKDLSQPAIKVFDGVTFGNDFTIDSKGIIYYSDSSKQWDRRNFPNLVLENSATGMLVKYNESSGEKIILSADLSFANGVELSHDEHFIMVTETNRARLARYWLEGPKKGFWDYLNPNLPGLPDNIRRSTRGTYWIAMATARPSFVIDSLSEWPVVRSQMAKLGEFYPSLRQYMIKKHGMIVEINNEGRVLRVFEDKSGSVFPSASEVEETVDGVLYLGSYALPYIIKLTPEQFH